MEAFCMRWLRKNLVETCNWILQQMLLGIGSRSGFSPNRYNFHFWGEEIGARPFQRGEKIPKTG
jgi:hypothetical protein